MKETVQTLNIYHLSHPMMNTDWYALMGDKYQKSLSFQWQTVFAPAEADIVVWDGVITPKLAPNLEGILNDLTDKKVLLLVGEAYTLLKNHPMVKLAHLEKLRYVEISGWTILPEDILRALELCYQKLKHV